jgi:CRISPR-associated protein Csm3
MSEVKNKLELIMKIVVKGNIKALTGIAIGGANTAMNIGGIDKGIIRNPLTKEPYIPGSSLKGKMRSLLELKYGTIGDEKMGVVINGAALDLEKHPSARLFGNVSKDMISLKTKQKPSRLIVRDAALSNLQTKEKNKNDFFKDTELPFAEVKTEVVIDRITARAMPRQLERVPAGAMFDFELVLNIFRGEGENKAELVTDMFTALGLVQDDYIGGSGSRGSGQIAFCNLKVYERTMDYYKSDNTEGGDSTDKTANYEKYLKLFNCNTDVSNA